MLNLFRLNDGSQVDLVLLSMGEWELTRALTGREEPAGEGASPNPGGISGVRPSRVRVLSDRRIRPRTIWDIRRALREERAGLLVSQGVVANAYARAAAVLGGVPSLVVVHSDLSSDYPRPLARWSYTLIERLLRPATKRYIAVAQYLKDRLVASGVDADRVRVIYNGVDDSGAAAEEGPARPGGSVHRTTLVSLGRLHPVKNFDGLIEAMTLLPDGVGLEIWGSGPEREGLAGLVAARGLGGRVKLCGDADGMAHALSRGDIYVQPSKSEGCSFAVVEAMLQGRPVVVAPRGGMPEQIDDGRTGVVATGVGPEELAEAIMRVIGDPESAARLAEQGRRTAQERFSLDRWLHDTISAFAETAR